MTRIPYIYKGTPSRPEPQHTGDFKILRNIQKFKILEYTNYIQQIQFYLDQSKNMNR